jgi:hypothetical protein
VNWPSLYVALNNFMGETSFQNMRLYKIISLRTIIIFRPIDCHSHDDSLELLVRGNTVGAIAARPVLGTGPGISVYHTNPNCETKTNPTLLCKVASPLSLSLLFSPTPFLHHSINQSINRPQLGRDQSILPFSIFSISLEHYSR